MSSEPTEVEMIFEIRRKTYEFTALEYTGGNMPWVVYLPHASGWANAIYLGRGRTAKSALRKAIQKVKERKWPLK